MRKIISILLLVVSFSLYAQNCTYNFSVSTGTYQNLTNNTSLNNGAVWDDPLYAVPVGFNFEICGNTYGTVYISDWGYGGSLFSEKNPAGVLSMIVPFAQDIIDRGHLSGVSQSPLSYKTVGTTGNRILKIEWNNVGFLGNQSDYMNFQVWLYENTNAVAFHYGPSSVSPSSFEGETGPNTFFWPQINWDTGSFPEPGYVLTGNPSNPTLFVINPNNPSPPPSSTTLNGMIPPGTIYTFTPDNLSIKANENIVFSVFPNPVENTLHIQTNTAVILYKIEIFSLTGQHVETFTKIKKDQINMAELASGIYFVKVTNTKGVSGIRKIIKE